jgi:hypothetical protein
VLSPYWVVADTSLPISVRQLADYHTMSGVVTKFKWYAKGSPSSRNQVFSADANDAQSVLPHGDGPNGWAAGKFQPGTPFGLYLDGEFSDDTLNRQEQPGGGYGHHVRAYPVRDRNGNYVANTWLVVMDYADPNCQNFDYQDTVYLIGNMRPDNRPTAPMSFSATSGGSGELVQWAPVFSSQTAGYNLYRSPSLYGGYSLLNTGGLLTASQFVDATAQSGTRYYYRVTTVNSVGTESSFAGGTAVK